MDKRPKQRQQKQQGRMCSNVPNAAVVDAGEVPREQVAERPGLACCLLPLLASALG